MNKRNLILVAGLCLLVISSTGTLLSVFSFRSFHVEGQFIKDDLGNTVRFTGVGFDASFVSQCIAAWGRNWHSDLMVEKGVNIVRIFVCYGWWTGEYTDYDFPIERDTYRAGIDRIVSELHNNGIYCWINMEGSYAKQQEWSLDSSNWISTLQEIALRYESYPNFIGIEPQNEPNDWCWEDRYYVRLQEVANGIHEVAPNLLIFADTGIHGWSHFDSNFPLDEPNVVYCYHCYYQHWGETLKSLYRSGQYVEAKALLESALINNLYWLQTQGYPVMDTELGVAQTDEFPEANVFLQDYFDLMEKYGIHWTYFDWNTKDPTRYSIWMNDWAEPTPHGAVVLENLDSLIQSTPEPEPEEVYACPYCGSQFDTIEELADHIRSDHPSYVYVCPYCSAEFASVDDFVVHLETYHQPVPETVVYECPYCGLEFDSIQELVDHLESVHPSEVYVCPYCYLEFDTPEALAAHLESEHQPEPEPEPEPVTDINNVLAFAGFGLLLVYSYPYLKKRLK